MRRCALSLSPHPPSLFCCAGASRVLSTLVHCAVLLWLEQMQPSKREHAARERERAEDSETAEHPRPILTLGSDAAHRARSQPPLPLQLGHSLHSALDSRDEPRCPTRRGAKWSRERSHGEAHGRGSVLQRNAWENGMAASNWSPLLILPSPIAHLAAAACVTVTFACACVSCRVRRQRRGGDGGGRGDEPGGTRAGSSSGHTSCSRRGSSSGTCR